jgi:RNA polymerase sigma-70 factor (ECF subfamily)
MGSSYSGAFEDWEIAMARRLSSEFLAQHGWIKGYDVDDLMQECLIQWYLAHHTYQPGKGTSRRTYMARVVKRRLQNILNEQLAEKRAADRFATSLDELLGATELGLKDLIPTSQKPAEPDISLKLDLQRALSRLTPDQRKLCLLLRQGYGIREISIMLRKPRATIYDDIKRIRKTFTEAGMDEYLA